MMMMSNVDLLYTSLLHVIRTLSDPVSFYSFFNISTSFNTLSLHICLTLNKYNILFLKYVKLQQKFISFKEFKGKT